MVNTKRLMLCKEIIVVNSDNLMKHISILCLQTAELFILKVRGTYSKICSLKD
jgi:hypothetical protein